MRKLRDFDSKLKALDDKAKQLKQAQVRQLGELVMATGANTLDIEVLTGALLDATKRDDLTIREEWRARGAAFFRKTRSDARRTHGQTRGASSSDCSPLPATGEAGA